MNAQLFLDEFTCSCMYLSMIILRGGGGEAMGGDFANVMMTGASPTNRTRTVCMNQTPVR